ncbi:Cupin domain-containing protein [Halogranum gelatinilyticum]|uniref:Cupin domain-containing protein n=1 Tax=Halogranum gelatinilyticum TaxID=660521 RepID=A0A1G9TQ90_9EURY|nr:cupin domain-containing protein [Halogranum gelatinilyticum]SDM49584.1 Cupin domain-containing protein [Halogranum gelatinilyticum]
MEKVNVADGFDSFDETWSPRLAAELNGQAVKFAKLDGEFVWHHHDDADELFFVTSGELRIELREREDIHLTEGEFVVVPRGVEHRPVALPEADVILFEPAETRNTGNVESERTADVERL